MCNRTASSVFFFNQKNINQELYLDLLIDIFIYTYSISKKVEPNIYLFDYFFTMRNIIYDFLQYAKDILYRSQDVLNHYRYDLLNLEQFLLFKHATTKVNIEEITMQECIQRIENYKENRKVSKNTLSWKATSMKQFFKYCSTMWYKLKFNIEQLPNIKKERKPYDMMKKSEYEIFIQAPLFYEEKEIIAERNQLLIEIPYKTWLRRSEILRCKFEHFKSENRQFQILWKWWYYDRVFFTDDLWKKVLQFEKNLKEYTKKRPMKTDYIFVWLDNKNRWKPLASKYVNILFRKYSENLMKEWKIERRLHPHMERHAFATNCVYAGLSQQATTRLMRHRDPKTTEWYYHMNDTWLKSQYDMIQ